jgi:TPR repeat protein
MLKALTLAALAVTLHSGSLAADTVTLAQAHQAYYTGQYGRSLALYRQLAEAGDAEAAERAGFMLFYGEDVFGKQVQRNVPKARELFMQAAMAGRTGASFLMNMVGPQAD